MIKKAIDTSNIVSYFQPIVCNKTKAIVKYESPYLFLDIGKRGKYYARITSIVL